MKTFLEFINQKDYTKELILIVKYFSKENIIDIAIDNAIKEKDGNYEEAIDEISSELIQDGIFRSNSDRGDIENYILENSPDEIREYISNTLNKENLNKVIGDYDITLEDFFKSDNVTLEFPNDPEIVEYIKAVYPLEYDKIYKP